MADRRGDGAAPLSRSVVLATDGTIARRARNFVAEALAELGRPELADVASLLVSELVTNVVRHTASGLCTVCLGQSGPSGAGGARPAVVVVEVIDTEADAPVDLEGPIDDRRESGRGLRIVATLADDWGVRRTREEKCVWFELGS